MSHDDNPVVAKLEEAVTNNWINQNIPGGLNSPVGQALNKVLGTDAIASSGPYNPAIANLEEVVTDSWINENIRGGLNSPAGQVLDRALGAQLYEKIHRKDK